MIRVLVLLLSLCAGCVQAHTERCTRVCNQEAECTEAEGTADEFDARECAIECTKLEREREGRELVTRHLECVARAESCTDIMNCQ